LVVLGVPSNDFGEQEPGSAADIKKFCETQYRIGFADRENRAVGAAHQPMLGRRHSGEAGTPRWNFTNNDRARRPASAGAWPTPVRPTLCDHRRNRERAGKAIGLGVISMASGPQPLSPPAGEGWGEGPAPADQPDRNPPLVICGAPFRSALEAARLIAPGTISLPMTNPGVP
jgi:hypothetical protein